MKFKNVIVTGGAGFIGSHLVDQLVDQAENVIIIDKVDPSDDRKNDKAEYFKINIQNPDIKNIFAKYQPEVIFHLAAHLHDRESVEKPVENAMDNVVGFLNVCESVQKNGNGKIIFTSSCAVYGNQDLPISEKNIPIPLTPYGITKLVGENYLRFYNRAYNIPYIAFRPGNIYGPRQDSSSESGVIGIFSSRLLGGNSVVINNDGETTRDYIFVSDVVDALLRGAISDFVGVLNLGTGAQTSTNQVFEMVCKDVGCDVVPDKNENQRDAIKHIELDASQTQRILNWKPTVRIDEGIKQTVEWYRDNL